MTPERRQRPIPVTSSERKILDTYKGDWENRTGSQSDWGEFLGAVVLLGLAAAGIYALAEVIARNDPHSLQVSCPKCSQRFVVAVPQNTGEAVQVGCPHCQASLVVPVHDRKS